MTPQEEIAGLTKLLNAWKIDCQHYEQGLRDVRLLCVKNIDSNSMTTKTDKMLMDIIKAINSCLRHDERCWVCGDTNCDGGLPCQTGDGV